MGDASDPIPCLDALKELRKDNTFLKEDINDNHLSSLSCHPQSKMRFNYLAEWDPDRLITTTYRYLPESHAMIEHRNDLRFFVMYFQTALKHHPQHLGMLFQKDNDGETQFERAINKYGEDKILNAIKQCVPTESELLILHHVVKNAPKYMNTFSIRYLSAMYLHDDHGRTLTQATLNSGPKTLKSDTIFFGKMTDDEIAEVDLSPNNTHS
jgi:hypothetical protein